VYARAVSVIVTVDGETHAKRPLADTERDALLEHVVTA
jgi:acyl-CoA thioester hydrolase